MHISAENASYYDQLIAASPELSGNLDAWQAYQQLHARYHAFLEGLPKRSVREGGTPKAIWWCWLQGAESAPPLCQACFDSLVRNMPDDWQIFIITEANYHELVTLPAFIEQKYRQGIISRTHFSDILRLALLTRYGGAWIDATVYCSEDAGDFLAAQPLFAYQHIWRGSPGIPASNWLISAVPHHPILEATQLLLCHFWQENDVLPNYFLFHLLWKMAAEKYPMLWHQMPRYSNVPPHFLQMELLDPYTEERKEQIFRMSRFHKLTYHLPALTEAQLRGTFLEKILASREKLRG